MRIRPRMYTRAEARTSGKRLRHKTFTTLMFSTGKGCDLTRRWEPPHLCGGATLQRCGKTASINSRGFSPGSCRSRFAASHPSETRGCVGHAAHATAGEQQIPQGLKPVRDDKNRGSESAGSSPRRWLFLFGVHQAKFFQLVAQRIAADVQQAGRLRLIAVGLLHGHLHQCRVPPLPARFRPRGWRAWAEFAPSGELLGRCPVDRAGLAFEGRLRLTVLADRERQVIRAQLILFFQDHGALDGVFQFAHIARPVVLEQQLAQSPR